MATYGGSIYDEVMGTFSARREAKEAAYERSLDLRKKLMDVEQAEVEAPRRRAEAKRDTLQAEFDVMMMPEKVQLEQQELRQKFQTSMVDMRTEELEDVYRMLSSATNQEQYNTSLSMLMARYPDFDPTEYGLTEQFDSKTRTNLKQLNQIAVENLPHKRAVDLQQKRLEHEEQMQRLRDKEETITKSRLEGAALAKIIANQAAEQAGQPRPYELTQAESLLVQNALRNPDTAAVLQVAMMSIPAMQALWKGDSDPLTSMLSNATDILGQAQVERQLTPAQSTTLQQGRELWQRLRSEGHSEEDLKAYKAEIQEILSKHDIPRELLR